MSEKPVFCILSTDTMPPKEAVSLWKKNGEICCKPGFFFKGLNYRVYFPNISLLWNDKNSSKAGFNVTWGKLRDEVEFTQLAPGLMQGVLKDKDAVE